MKTTLPNQKIKQTILFVLFLLLFSISNGFGQSESGTDGNYCPIPGSANDEYATGTVFKQIINSNASTTCAINTIWAKVNTQSQVLKIGIKIGNSGSALFRMYLDTDNNASTGLTTDSFGGTMSVAGAEYILELDAKNNSTFILYKATSFNTKTITANNNFSATNGNSNSCTTSGDGQFLEFNIPFGSIGINICDSNNPGLINIAKLASVSGGSSTSNICNDIPLTFGIPLKGSVGPNSTVCSGINSTNLSVSGLTGSSTITKWEYSISPFSTWTSIANTTSTHTATNLTETTKFRAVILNTGLCTNGFNTSEATITVESCCTTPVIANKIATICSGTSFTVTPVNGGSEVVPTGTTYSWSAPTNATGISGNLAGTNQTSISGTLTNSNNFPLNVIYTVTPKSGTCTGTPFTVTVTVNPKPTATISGTNAVCKDATAPNITFTGASGTAPYTFTYKINGGNDLTVTTTSGNSVTVAVPTTTAGSFVYSLVSVKDAGSTTCSQAQTGSATITVNDPPTATITGDLSACLTTTLTANTNASSPTYVWYKNNVVINGQTASTLIVTANGDYKVKITNGLTSCETTSAVSTVVVEDVTKPAKPVLADVTG
ncbi:PKD-like domain-containing protein, partial [Flavobacterium flevense]